MVRAVSSVYIASYSTCGDTDNGQGHSKQWQLQGGQQADSILQRADLQGPVKIFPAVTGRYADTRPG